MANPRIKNANFDDEEEHSTRINDLAKKFIADCAAEKERLGDDFPIGTLLYDEAIDRIQATGRIPGREMQANVFKQKLMKVSQKVFVPIKQYPNFNFIGKILGPKGNSLRNLQKETLCWILIKGRNSMRDSAKEEQLRQSGDPRHAHLNKDLYVEISTVAPPAEAYARVAYALTEIRKYLIPDSNDEVSQTQLKQILADPELAKKAGGKFREKVAGRKPYGDPAFKTTGVSIFQKIIGSKAQDETEHESANGSEVQRQPMKRPAQGPPSYQRKNFASGNYEEEGQSFRGQMNKKPVSILKKVTGFTDQQEYGDEEQEYEDESYQQSYDDEERSYNHKPFMSKRQNMSQGPPMKRSYQEPSSYNQRRFDGPRKRTFDVPTGGPSVKSRFAFLQNN